MRPDAIIAIEMALDICIAGFLAFIAALIGYLGFRVTIYPAQSYRAKNFYKAAFTTLGALSVALVVFQGFRNNQAQSELKDLILKAGTGPSLSFVGQRSVTFRHNLNTRALQLACYDDQGNSMATMQGWKIVDQNTATLDFSVPQTGTCGAKR